MSERREDSTVAEQARQVEITVSGWKQRFRILADWEISFCHESKHKGKISTNPDCPRARFYPWPSDKEVPNDFYFHEMLHLALRAYKRIPDEDDRRPEENLIRDICDIYKTAMIETAQRCAEIAEVCTYSTDGTDRIREEFGL